MDAAAALPHSQRSLTSAHQSLFFSPAVQTRSTRCTSLPQYVSFFCTVRHKAAMLSDPTDNPSREFLPCKRSAAGLGPIADFVMGTADRLCHGEPCSSTPLEGVPAHAASPACSKWGWPGPSTHMMPLFQRFSTLITRVGLPPGTTY